MIRLVRPAKPAELTGAEVAKRILEFKASKKAVWLDDFIRVPLFEMSKQKCAYCEAAPTTQRSSLDVEHYHHKDKYPDEVINWDNLLPSCSACNTNKSTFDTKQSPSIINPCRDNPQDHLFFFGNRLKGKTDNGKLTIEKLGLNPPLFAKKKPNDIDWAAVRYGIINYNQNQLAKSLEELVKIQGYQSNYKKKKSEFNQVALELFNFMQAISPTEPYTALHASIFLHPDSDYWEIKPILENNGLWTQLFQDLEDEISGFALLK